MPSCVQPPLAPCAWIYGCDVHYTGKAGLSVSDASGASMGPLTNPDGSLNLSTYRRLEAEMSDACDPAKYTTKERANLQPASYEYECLYEDCNYRSTLLDETARCPDHGIGFLEPLVNLQAPCPDNVPGCVPYHYKTKDHGTSELVGHTNLNADFDIKDDRLTFKTKDSGERQQFESGMQRDVQTGKVRYDLALDGPLFQRYAELMTRGAEKYSARNWMKAAGDEELERFRASAVRHFIQWYKGDTDEDHAAAVVFNLNGAEYVKEKMK